MNVLDLLKGKKMSIMADLLIDLLFAYSARRLIVSGLRVKEANFVVFIVICIYMY